ncbi:aldehyde dehydrogenase family protein [Aminobacter sp. J44]|uniref:aldehyde dehydrogenase family protein n=1 Tax=Aminobacter sp. J44 TaxID=935262 RepID=UPI001AEDA2D9|nr:aldehyde dehydrogenase family protein [Aminobacter sp. J44]
MLDRELPGFRAGLGRSWGNFIAGRQDQDGTAYISRSPINTEIVLGTFIEPSTAAITRAVAAARGASEIWGKMPWQERLKRLAEVREMLNGRKYELAMAVMHETGKTRVEALAETEEAVALLDYYCDQMQRHEGFVEPSNSAMPGETSQTFLRPFGTFGIICPFNYPVALPVGMIAPALAAGNTVVAKWSPAAGLTGSMLAEIFSADPLPAGTFNSLCGTSSGPRLVEEPGVDGIAFTGSHSTGMAILRKIASGPFMRPVLAEMGGKNPTYVAQSADPLIAAEGIAKSAFNFQGQKCTATSVAFVHESHYDTFVTEVLRRVEALKFGDSIDRSVTNGPLINEVAVRRFEEAAAHAAEVGTLLCGGTRIQGELSAGHFVRPAVVTNLPEDDLLFKTELFAPLLIVAPFISLSEAIDRGNSVNMGLAAGFFGNDEAELVEFLNRAQAGVLYANRRNGATNGAWPGIQSFAGWKGSGLTGKGALGPHYLPQFMREQSRTISGFN